MLTAFADSTLIADCCVTLLVRCTHDRYSAITLQVPRLFTRARLCYLVPFYWYVMPFIRLIALIICSSPLLPVLLRCCGAMGGYVVTVDCD